MPKPSRAIVLHARSLSIDYVEVLGPDGHAQRGRWHHRSAWTFKVDLDELVVSFPEPVTDGSTLAIGYQGTLNDDPQGLYRARSGGAWVALTQFEPTDARRVFPCFDEPRFKVPFQIEITTPRGNLAFSNGRLARATRRAGWIHYEFEPTHPLPTYLVAVAVGPFQVMTSNEVALPLRLVTPPGHTPSSEALRLTARFLGDLQQIVGLPYPFSKLDIVGAPNLSPSAMEHPGLVTVRTETLLLDRDASALERSWHAEVLAHELAHMWFGNLVSPADWSHVWLNEGLATWTTVRVLEQARPELQAGLTFAARSSNTMDLDTSTARPVRESVGSVTEAFEAFDEFTYVKGAALISMLDAWVGRGVTDTALGDYLRRHRWGSATSGDLFEAFNRAAGGDVTSWTETFLARPGVPGLDATVDCANGPTIELTRSSYTPRGARGTGGKTDWRFPVCFRYPMAERVQSACTLLEGPVARVPLASEECPAWVYPNAEQVGYYRLLLSDAQLTTLASAFDRLSPRERLGLLFEARPSLEDGRITLRAYLDLLKRYRGADSWEVWEEITDALIWLDEIAAETPAQPALREVVRSLLRPELDRIGETAQPGEPFFANEIRRNLRRGLGRIGADPDVLSHARDVTEEWLKTSENDPGDGVYQAVLIAAHHGDAALYERIFQRARKPDAPGRYLAIRALGAFTDPRLAHRTLDYLDEKSTSRMAFLGAFYGLLRHPSTRKAAIDHLGSNVTRILEGAEDRRRGELVQMVSAACGARSTADLRALFRPALQALEGADRALERGLELSERCVALERAMRPRLATTLGSGARHEP